MIDRIDKALRKLTPKQRDMFAKLLAKIIAGDLRGLDVLRLQGTKDIFRVRKGSYRIIFRRDVEGGITVIAFEHRSESTYNDF